MSSVTRFEELDVWAMARELSKTIYGFAKRPEFHHDMRFASQITSSAGSIMDNIAEGFEREGKKEFIQFLYIAKGSCGELQSQLYQAFDCGYIAHSELSEALDFSKRLGVKIKHFLNYLKTSEIKGTKYKKD